MTIKAPCPACGNRVGHKQRDDDLAPARCYRCGRHWPRLQLDPGAIRICWSPPTPSAPVV